MKSHLKIENERGEILVDADVSDVVIETANVLRWKTLVDGEEAALLSENQSPPDEHEVWLNDVKKIVLKPL